MTSVTKNELKETPVESTKETKDPRIFYYVEHQRHIVAVFDHDVETGKTKYGASIFVKPGVCDDKCVSKTNSWSKKPHRDTAMTRFERFPVDVNIKAKDFKDLKKKLRNEIHKHGVQKR
jgi:Uma2 family endonuclease